MLISKCCWYQCSLQHSVCMSHVLVRYFVIHDPEQYLVGLKSWLSAMKTKLKWDLNIQAIQWLSCLIPVEVPSPLPPPQGGSSLCPFAIEFVWVAFWPCWFFWSFLFFRQISLVLCWAQQKVPCWQPQLQTLTTSSMEPLKKQLQTSQQVFL